MSGGWSTQPLVLDQMAHSDDLLTCRHRARRCAPAMLGGLRMSPSSAELRKQSFIALAWARQTRADAEAARLRAVRCRTRATAAALSVIARIHATKAATRRNTERHTAGR
jgi:hypothetical protein